MQKRIKNIFNNLKKKPDLIIIKNSVEPFIDDNFFYVTGLNKGLFEGCIAILYPNGEIDLVVSELEAESAKKAKANILVYKNKEEFEEYFKKILSKNKTIGLNFYAITHKDFSKLKKKFSKKSIIDISESLSKTRAIKDQIEIDYIKKACEVVDRVITKIPDLVHKGIYEYEIAAEINYLMEKYGAAKPAFDTISSFGKNTAEPHYTHGDKKLNSGDFMLFDFGANYNKYNSDLTRTFIFDKADKKQKEIYETVFNAQKIGLDKIKPGVKADSVHNAVSSFIDKSKFKGCFIHSTGHSLGLSVHDGIGFSPEADFEIKENMVFTVEPGIYVPGFGGVRIEDDVLISKGGYTLLTKSSKDFLEI